MNSIQIYGLAPSTSEDDRTTILVDVVYNDENYKWQIRMPNNFKGSFSDFVNVNSEKIYNDIQTKLDAWATHPKTKKIVTIDDNDLPTEITVAITKEEIVKPTYPDYYVLRKKEYPSIFEQLDCLWKDDVSVAEMKEKILEIKAKYPKSS